MTKIKNKMHLRERVKQNYIDFMKNILQLNKLKIVDLAPLITAVQEMYSAVITFDILSDDETEFLLKYKNPLKLLATAWLEERRDHYCAMMLENIKKDGVD